jgi:hypothetical protein
MFGFWELERNPTRGICGGQAGLFLVEEMQNTQHRVWLTLSDKLLPN